MLLKSIAAVSLLLSVLLFLCLDTALWLVPVLFAGIYLVLALLAFGYTAQFVTPLYRANVTIYVNNINANETIEYISASNLATAQQLVNTYVNMIRSNTVLEKVADSAGLNYTPAQIRSMMTASQKGETELFDVFISHPDPEMAARIANAIAEVAPGEIAEFVEGSSTKIIDHATPATAPYSPNTSRNTTYGMAAGAILAACFIILQTLLDVRVKSEEDLTRISDAPVLGIIPDLTMESKEGYGYGGYQYTAYKAGTNPSNEEADV